MCRYKCKIYTNETNKFLLKNGHHTIINAQMYVDHVNLNGKPWKTYMDVVLFSKSFQVKVCIFSTVTIKNVLTAGIPFAN